MCGYHPPPVALRRNTEHKNGLDAGIVKAFSVFTLAVYLRNDFIYLGKAVPHLLNISPVFRRSADGNGAAVEAQLHGGHIVLRGPGEDGTEQDHQHDQRGENGHDDPAHLFAGFLIGEDRYRRFDCGRNAGTHRLMLSVGRSLCWDSFCRPVQYVVRSFIISSYPSFFRCFSAHALYCSKSIP